MTTPLPTEYFTEAEAKRSVDCPNTMARDDEITAEKKAAKK